jgi:hypothetical protein
MNIEDLDRALKEGPYTSIGSYPIYFMCWDGETLSYNSVKENYELVCEAIENKDKHSGWYVIGYGINWENEELIDADTGEKIECAYPSH